ncbi:MAG: FAD-dependent oxidoreductase, partial [Pseudomonadota bacterium]
MLTRRNILRFCYQGPLFAGALTSGRVSRSQAQGLGTDYDVIIVGAGVAGLAAAESLLTLDDELKVLVLEARDRIGGRVYSVRRDDLSHDVDLGAQYINAIGGVEWEPIKRLQLRAESAGTNKVELRPGSGALTRALASVADGNIQLNSRVSEVFWRDGLAGVYYDNRGLRSAVTTRRLLVTLPPAVLRAGGLVFTPTLDLARQEAISDIAAEPSLSCAMVFNSDKAPLLADGESWTRDSAEQHFRARRTGNRNLTLLEAQYRGVSADTLASEEASLVLRLALQEFEPALKGLPLLEDSLWSAYTDWQQDQFSAGGRSVAGTAS